MSGKFLVDLPIINHCSALCCNALYGIVLCCIVSYCTVWCSIGRCYVVLYGIALHYTLLYCTALHSIITQWSLGKHVLSGTVPQLKTHA